MFSSLILVSLPVLRSFILTSELLISSSPAKITHGGYLSALIDAGAGTAAHRSAENSQCVTISLDIKFIGASKLNDEIIGNVKILKKTNTLVFLFCELRCKDKTITSASGVWKILKKK